MHQPRKAVTMTTTPEINKRAALALRGRYGCDVWERWCNLGMHDQQDWLAKKVPGRCPVEMRKLIIGILYKEGIERTKEARCCSTCSNPVFNDV